MCVADQAEPAEPVYMCLFDFQIKPTKSHTK